MKRLGFAMGMLLASTIATSLVLTQDARAEHTRMTNPNALSAEVLGRGLLFALQYDRVITDDLVAGIGWGQVGVKDAFGNSLGINTGMIPLYVNYYFMRDAGSLFVTGGATLVTSQSSVFKAKSTVGNVTFGSSSVLPEVGVGYENRGDSGFLFRLAAYGIIADSFSPWFGFTFGYAF